MATSQLEQFQMDINEAMALVATANEMTRKRTWTRAKADAEDWKTLASRRGWRGGFDRCCTLDPPCELCIERPRAYYQK